MLPLLDPEARPLTLTQLTFPPWWNMLKNLDYTHSYTLKHSKGFFSLSLWGTLISTLCFRTEGFPVQKHFQVAPTSKIGSVNHPKSHFTINCDQKVLKKSKLKSVRLFKVASMTVLYTPSSRQFNDVATWTAFPPVLKKFPHAQPLLVYCVLKNIFFLLIENKFSNRYHICP